MEEDYSGSETITDSDHKSLCDETPPAADPSEIISEQDDEESESGGESIEFSSVHEFEQTTDDSEDSYGGRGDPEGQREAIFLLGDIVEFSYEGNVYFGEVKEIEPGYT